MNNPSIFFLLFILLWVGLTLLFSFIGGWRELARFYSYQSQAIDKKRYMQSASMRGWMGYKGCLTIGANPEGLYISVLFLFRVGHPSLFIPWSAIKIGRKKVFGFPMLVLKFAQTPSITLAIPQSLEDFLKKSSARELPFETTGEIPEKSGAQNWYWWVNVIAGTIGLLAALYAMFFAPHRRF